MEKTLAALVQAMMAQENQQSVGGQHPCLSPGKQSSNCADINDKLQSVSKEINASDTFQTTPGMISLERIEAMNHQTASPNSAEALLQKPEFDSENGYLVGKIEHESSKTSKGNQFLDDYGKCMQLDSDLNRPEIKTPKVPELQNSAKTFKFQNGGNTKIVDSLITEAGQDLGMFERLIWKPFEQDLSGQLEWVGLNKEIPSLQVPPEFVIATGGSGQLLLYFPAVGGMRKPKRVEVLKGEVQAQMAKAQNKEK
ncbi:unnamed protein product [Linum trigynum]|uniref:Uncharacterized protein n=1 Tax=Linum trigynum TaxID=586398 RepID=A0AAV2FQV0_9ROSI